MIVTLNLTEEEQELLKAMCLNVRSNGNTVNPKPIETTRAQYVAASQLYCKLLDAQEVKA